ncbi:MAG: ESPR-type extended signal peptide-containing protein [Rhodanobacter sp.]
MNRIYRVVWNSATNSWVVASEMAKGRKKSSVSKAAKVLSLAIAVAAGSSGLISTADAQSVTPVTADSTTTDAGNVSQVQQPVGMLGDDTSGWILEANGVNPGTVGGANNTVNVVNGVNTGATYNPVTGNLEIDVVTNPTFTGLVTAKKGLNMSGTVISNVANGIQATDAVNLGQLNSVLGDGVPYFHVNSTAADSQAIGTDSIAVGPKAVAGAVNTELDTAMGANAAATGGSSIALGSYTVASAAGSVAVGSSAAATAVGDVMVGSSAGLYAVSLGNNTGIGNQAGRQSNGAFNTAVGSDSGEYVNGYYNVAVGTLAGNLMTANNTVSVGASSRVSATNSVAIGASADASSANSVALGANSTTTAVFSQAAYNPFNAAVSGRIPAGEVSVGSAGAERRLTNVAAGSAMTDAVNVSQLQSVAAVAGAGWTMEANGVNPGTVGPNAPNTGGVKTINVVNGVNTGATYNPVSGNLEIDVVNAPTFSGLVTAQKGLDMTGTKIINVGPGVAPTDAVNYGQLTAAVSNASEYFHANSTGTDSNPIGADSVAIGTSAVASNANDVALGSNSTTAAAVGTSSVTVGGVTSAVASSAPVATVSVGSQGSERTITNMAAGRVSATSTDAVNGSELYATNQAVDQTNTDVTNLSNTVTNQGDQINSIYTTGTKYFHANSTGADSVATGADSVAIGTGAVSNNANDVALGAGSVTAAANATPSGSIAGTTYSYAGGTPTSVVSVGSVGNERQITNVAAGQVSATSTDAVNGSQLNATNTSINNLSNTVTAATTGIVKYDVNTDGSVNYNNVTMGGRTSTDGGVTGGTKITNVAQGELSSTSTDAVNGAQLNQTNTNVTNQGNQINSIYTTGTKYFHANSTGADSVATGQDAVAIGMNAQATADSSVALGANSTTTANLAAAAYNPGTGTLAGMTPAGEVSVGSQGNERRITNVAAGADATDAVNVSQLMSVSTAMNGLAQDAVLYDNSQHQSVTFGGAGASAPVILRNVGPGSAGTDAVNVNQLNALQTQVTNIDGRVTNIENNGGGGGGTAIPYLAGNTGNGTNNHANAGDSAGVALGYNADASGDNASVVGQNATALGSYGTAVGNDSYAAGANDTALGGNAKVNADGSVAVGAGAQVSASATNAVAMGANASVAAASGTAVGQGATVQAQATGAVALGQGSVADRANTVSVGSAGNTRQITNVQAGVQQTDAVNVSQLSGVTSALGGGSTVDNSGNVVAPSYNVGGNTYNNVGDALGNLDSRLNDNFNQLNNEINQNAQQANRGIAASAALVQATPYMPGRTMLNAGVASYRGESALGVGVSRWSSDGRINVNAGVSAAMHDQPIFRVGVGVVLGD